MDTRTTFNWQLGASFRLHRTVASRLTAAVGWGGMPARRTMFGRKKHKGLYYLMPGMTRANREKRRRLLRWAFAVGTLTALLVAGVVWWANRL